MKPITLRAHEVRQLQTAGEVLVVRNVKDAYWWLRGAVGPASALPPCPLGTPTDRLWVRETWGIVSHAWDETRRRVPWAPDRPATEIREMPIGRGYYSGHVIYAADGQFEWSADDDGGGDPVSAWRSPVVMPRWASRFGVEIAEVHARHVQTITEAEAIAAGVQLGGPIGHIPSYRAGPYAYHFAQLWDYMNGPDSWSENPWVWFVRTRRVEA